MAAQSVNRVTIALDAAGLASQVGTVDAQRGKVCPFERGTGGSGRAEQCRRARVRGR